MAILELIKLGEISSEQAKAYVVNVFRNSGFKKNIVYK
jgi:polyhydroxyalkanoate synthesis regulator phasin